MRRTYGFTLLELLVVLVIIGIVTTVALISLGSLVRDPPAKQAATQLADLTGLAAEQAVMQSQQYGLLVEPHAYAFYIYDGHSWTVAQDDSLFGRHELGDDVTLTLDLDGAPVTLAPPPATVTDAAPASGTASAPASGQTESVKPQLLFLSSGELQPFTLTVSGADKGGAYTVKGTLADGIQLVTPDEGKPSP
ncbi:MAG TPA: type II secretion system minor pseudopilin GspH [Gammaproteobacteria bacterium]|nr:type II secretion system minor pseudopilin GspH [Gammaproteobacteria bacterium]